MGTYAELVKEHGAVIPVNKRAEFEQRIEKLFQVSGMMEMKHLQMYGKTIRLIKKASMHKFGMDFYYSYFDDCGWENVGFDKQKYHIFSNKVGGIYFMDVIIAAYILESFYLNGPTSVTINDEIISPLYYVKWLYYLFQDASLFTDVYKDALMIAEPVTTEEFLDISHDDMILYWKEGGNIQFSDDLKNWFKELRKRFEELTAVKIKKKKRVKWIVEIMKYADMNYFSIYTIKDFFDETLEHLDDNRYIALWKIYEEMLHDPELKEAGSVIFSPEYDYRGIIYPKDELIRPLRTYWHLMSRDKRDNKARVTFKRYMALVANKELRRKVFGF